MKKLYLLLGVLASSGLAQAQTTCGTTVSVFPHIQNFETATAGSPGVLPTGWTGSPTTGYRWEVEDGPVGSTGTGPSADHTTGAAGGKYVYGETSSGATGAIAYLTSPCIDLTGLTAPGIQFWYHMNGATIGSLELEITTNGGNTWTLLPGSTISGAQQTAATDPWLRKTVSLAGNTGTAQVRFKITRGSSFTGDIAIDDVKFFSIPAVDAEITALTSPSTFTGCGFTATENVTVTIQNNGNAAISSIPVRYQIGTNAPVNETANITIAPGATGTYTFTAKANLAAGGTYNLTATVLLPSDGDQSNDAKTRTIVNPLVATFPSIQDFATATAGAPGVMPSGWLASPATGFRWEVDTDQPASGTTSGPAADHTTGTPGNGKYAFTESSSGAAGAIAYLTSPCINLTGLTTPGMEFWYHMHGATTGSMEVEISTDGGTTWTLVPGSAITGPQQTSATAPWQKKVVSFTGFTGTVQVRFKGTRGSGTSGDMAIDDVKFFNIPAIDAELAAITSPAVSGCGFTANENVTITIKNNGTTALTAVPVRYQIGTTTVNETASVNIAPGATGTYTFTAKVNLVTPGTYTLTTTVLQPSDGDPSNDVQTRTINVIPNISAFPYFQNFESGAGGWISGGTNSSWALGTPAKPIINTAGSGTSSWITSLTGGYNDNEDSYVVGPCFNFSTISQPIITMKIWWNLENNWDKAALQSSIDGGATWQHVGAFGDPNNWYNNNSTSGPGVGGGIKLGWSGRASTSNGSGGWVTAKHALTGLGGQSSVMLRIALGSDGSNVDDGFAFDDITIMQTPANDVGLTAFTAPVLSGCSYSATEQICIPITNHGSAATPSFQVSYQIGSNPAVTETVTTPIAPGATLNYCFTTSANLSAGGTYNFTFTTTLTGDADPSNNTITKTVVNPVISTLPHQETFASATAGAPGVLPLGWTASPTTGFRWEIDTDQPASGTGSGPAADHTTGTPGAGKYAFTESTSGSAGSFAYLTSPCINLTGLANPGVEFWYHMHGATIGSLELEISNNGGTTWTPVPNSAISGTQQTSNTAPWLKKTVSLAGNTGTVSVRFKATRGSGTTGDMAIDDLRFLDIPAIDAELTTVTLPANSCSLTTSENVCITVTNNGNASISNVPVSYTINGGTAVAETIPGPIAVGASLQYCFTTKANLSTPNAYTVSATVNLAGDGDNSNNTTTGIVTSIPTITANSLPYFQNFDNGPAGWTAGGANSSWVLGTPAKSVINTAASGTNSWVTSLSGTNNTNEKSFVQGPCFNFSGVADPDFEMKIWWESESSWDGAVLQSSIDGGATWQNVGAVGDPNNWYNDNSISGNPGEQPSASSAEGWTGRTGGSILGSGGWVLAKHKLTGLGGQSSVLLRVAFGADGSGNYDGFAFDDIRIGDNSNNLAINAFVPLTQICGFGTNEKVEVVLENQGSIPASGYTVSYTVNNGTTTTTPVSVPGPTLAPGTPTNFTFPTGANLSAPGAYTIVVTVTMAGDPDVSNNTITYTITNATLTGMPPVIDFETATTDLSIMRVVKGTKGNVTEGTGASFGTTSTEGMIMDATSATGWTIPAGPTNPWTNNLDNFAGTYLCFNPTSNGQNDSLWLYFDLKQLYKGASANTNFRVTVNGTPVGGNQTTPANTYRPPFTGTGGTTNWTPIKISLLQYANLPNIQIGFESSVSEPYANGTGTANLIDNIRIRRVATTTTGISKGLLAGQVNVYPNPSAGIFQVSLPEGKVYQLEVTDLTGRRILSKETRDNTSLDLSKAAKGIYLLKVTTQGASTMKKIIVE
ncbi:CARDB domain-containing protein [Adhaeribacter soli]|nr:CARDB domain-containing protein [Adhaeribacter soli]